MEKKHSFTGDLLRGVADEEEEKGLAKKSSFTGDLLAGLADEEEKGEEEKKLEKKRSFTGDLTGVADEGAKVLDAKPGWPG